MKTKPSLLIATLLFLSFAATAAVIENPGDTTPIELKYVGNKDHQPVFQLNITNANDDEYTVTIVDVDGFLFYYDRVKSKTFSQKFQFNFDDLENSVIRLSVRSKNKKTTEVFRINSMTKVVQEASVTRL